MTINIENLTPASEKAIAAGGTNNAVMGSALVKRGIFEKTENGAFKYMPTAEYLNFTEKAFADAMTAEEDAQEDGSHEAWQIAQWNADEKERAVSALRNEFEDADDDRREEIRNELARLGEVVYPVGSPQHDEYAAKLREALADPKAFDFLDFVEVAPVTPDAEQAFAEAVDADDRAAMGEILDGIVPAAVTREVRDPKEKRYAEITKWTDDNLDVKRGILEGRLRRRTLLRADRMQSERHLRTVVAEIERRAALDA